MNTGQESNTKEKPEPRDFAESLARNNLTKLDVEKIIANIQNHLKGYDVEYDQELSVPVSYDDLYDLLYSMEAALKWL